MTIAHDCNQGRLVEPLAPHRDRIAGCADRQSVPFVESTWRRWLRIANIESGVVARIHLWKHEELVKPLAGLAH